MIERVYLKEHLSFDEVELTFNEVELNLSKGLMIFTGPSGAGKSVLLQGILAIFAYFDANATMSEALLDENIDLRQDPMALQRLKEAAEKAKIEDRKSVV